MKLPPIDFNQKFTKADRNRLVQHLGEYRARRSEALKLYEPMPLQESFHQSRTYIRLYIGGNRSGKTCGTSTEFARMVMGCDPYDKYPKTNGRVYVVGKSLTHISDTIYPKLFQPGAFKIIRDEITDEWRTYRPWVAEDKKREKEAIQAPPLIPEKEIVGMGWESKSKKEIVSVRFRSGWEAKFFSATGQQPQGQAVHCVWFDEEIQKSRSDGDWFPEMSARLIDHGGCLIWSAAPQKGFDELLDLYEQGEKELAQYKLDPVKYPKPSIDIFQAAQGDNVYISADNRVRFHKYLTPEQRLIRESGEFNTQARHVYPEFSLATHGYPLEGGVPGNWTRYMYVDPGHSICAALFVACPPVEDCPAGLPMAVAYDEIYIPQANAVLFAQAVKLRTEEHKFEAFVIDMHGAKPHEAGSGLSIYEQYESELRNAGCFSRMTGYGFMGGSDDRKAGVMRGHLWLSARRKDGSVDFDQPPRFRVKTNHDRTYSFVPNFVGEMRRFKKKIVNGVVLDETHDRGPTHLCQCFRYCVMHGPEYVQVQMLLNGLQQTRKTLSQLAGISGPSSRSMSFGRSA